MCMEQFVSPVASRMSKVFLVKLLHERVVLRLPERQVLVLFVQGLCPFRPEVDPASDLRRLYRLAAAVDAAARARHYLYEVVFSFAVLYLFEQLLRISGAACNSSLYLHASCLDGRFLDAFYTTYCLEFHFFKRLAFEKFHGISQRSFHNAACCTEYDACACCFSHRVVEVPFRQFCEVDASFPDHLRQFSRGEYNIDVRIARSIHFRPLGLELLGRARHDRHY